MEMGLTTEQAAIVTHRGSDVLVTAGAGSGKTHVLVERYLSLLKDCRIPEIAAVTFTDAAATEMRERVRREVQERSDLQDHRKDLDEAAIGTFHSLCLRILRDHPVESALDPATRVLGEDEAELELMEACLDALEEAAQADDHRSKALLEIGVFAVTSHLPQMVRRRDEVEKAYRALAGAGPEDRAERVRSLLEDALQPAVEEARPELVELASWLRGRPHRRSRRPLREIERNPRRPGRPQGWRLDRTAGARIGGREAGSTSAEEASRIGISTWTRSRTECVGYGRLAPNSRRFPSGTSTTSLPWRSWTPCTVSSVKPAPSTKLARKTSQPWTTWTWRSKQLSCSGGARTSPLPTARGSVT